MRAGVEETKDCVDFVAPSEPPAIDMFPPLPRVPVGVAIGII